VEGREKRGEGEEGKEKGGEREGRLNICKLDCSNICRVLISTCMIIIFTTSASP